MSAKSEKRSNDDIKIEENVIKKVKMDVESSEVINKRQSDNSVGISEYIGAHQGFSGVLKQRYSDFLVSEISLDGTLVKLDRLSEPVEEEPSLPEADAIFSPEILEHLKGLADQTRTDPVEIEVENKSKDERRHIHTSVKKLHPDLCSDTTDKNGKKVTVIAYKKRRRDQNEGGFEKGQRQNWPASRGSYTHFVLYKENLDTQDAVNLIAKFLRMKPGAFTYSGVKDKRAKTVQMVSVYRTEARKLLALNKTLRNMRIGNVRYCKEPLRLGDLWGNRFQIILRNALGPQEAIDEAMQSLSEKGFLNYFGMQRFGTTSVPTYDVGLALLKSDWKLAVELIMKPRDGDDENMAKCRALWAETPDDPKKALDAMRRLNSIEANLLRGLIKHGTKDLVNALNTIPRNTRLMYVHSYQSYLWNRILSKKIAEYGLASVDGDLILKQKAEGERVGNKKLSLAQPSVLESGESASLYDIVIPLFGHDVQYPKNKIADWYREMLAEDGLNLNDFRHRVKDYSLSGTYRHVAIRPKDVRWSFLSYSDPNVPLLRSDWEVLKEEPLPAEVTDGTFRAVKLEFDLPSSCYATMAVRELLRSDTSSSFQSTLNVS